jgi:hypothetical protein
MHAELLQGMYRSVNAQKSEKHNLAQTGSTGTESQSPSETEKITLAKRMQGKF